MKPKQKNLYGRFTASLLSNQRCCL